MMHVPGDDRSADSGVGAANDSRRWRLRVDTSERNAALLDLARGCGDFEICMERLAVGDYLIDDGIVIGGDHRCWPPGPAPTGKKCRTNREETDAS